MSTYSAKYTTVSRGRQRAYQTDPQPFRESYRRPDGIEKWIVTEYPYYNPSPINIPPPTPIYGGVITQVAKKVKTYYFYEAYLIFIYGVMIPQPNVYGEYIFTEYEGSVLVAGTAYDRNINNSIRVDPDSTTVVVYDIYESLYSFISEYEYFETYVENKSQIDALPPNYLSLLDGYPKDTRVKSNLISGLTPSRSFNFRYQFYRQNRLEQLPVKSIDWITYDIDVIDGIPFSIDITDIVLGTFFCNDSSIENQIIGISLPNSYPLRYLFQSFLDELFIYWNSLVSNSPLPMIDLSDNRSSYTVQTVTDKKILTMAANNDKWFVGGRGGADKNYSLAEPFFDSSPSAALLATQRHFQVQLDNSLGSIVADSQRTIDMLTMVSQNKASLAALKITIDAIKTKVDSLTATDISALATSSGLAIVKDELDLVQESLELLKVEIL
jgi:hypothetical protein